MSITPFEFIVLVLAAWRATRFVTMDSLTDGWRERVERWVWKKGDRQVAWRDKVSELVGCGFCAGYWVSGITLAVFLVAASRWHEAPVLVHGIEWWAVAGGQALFNRYDVGGGKEERLVRAIEQD